MSTINLGKTLPILGLTASVLFLSCGKDNDGGTENPPNNGIEWKNHSVTPAFIKKLSGFESLEVYSLISSDDTLPQSPNYVFGGSADGSAY